ncbi:acetyl-CoA C-acetyltransferase [Paenibacillus albiflavus]|uniref:acetyl-CoA C-acetyltransferase n=1 Tax=Paenibacillus albiflavus TaxID=2545760 RepID=A0A4R4ENW7_9BACL|nr:acetyl-CoA C-acetyltransferase [Paenibacillus albiflavus]TCZ80135.1 acetyl-CoA C-acetyltransferase [Paenibacillus albiflavus]
MDRTVVVSAVRTPFGRFGGSLASLSAVDLGASVIKESLKRAAVSPDSVDEVIMGMVLQGGAGQIPSRQAAVQAGLPWTTPTETLNKVCASSMRAITLGDQIIRSGDAKLLVTGGMESMSNSWYALPDARWGHRMGDSQVIDLLTYDGLRCAFHNVPMAVLGSRIAAEYGIMREAQDEWALRSQMRAIAAMDEGRLADELMEIEVQNAKGERTVISRDEAPRRDTSLAKLSTLRPVHDASGTVTAGNAPGVNDGAAALVLMSESEAQAQGIKPLATILGHAEVGAEAAYIATTPGLAIQKLLHQTGYLLSEIDLFEVNEAFAAVILVSEQIVKWDANKVNVNGGAIALGHPLGASGARIVSTLIYELRRRGGGLGIAAICSGAAQGDAILIRVNG